MNIQWKGNTLLITMAFFMTFISGCGTTSDTAQISQTTETQKEIQGVLERAPSGNDTQFIVKTMDGKVLGLTSSTVSFETYTGKQVILTGTFKDDEQTIFQASELRIIGASTNQNMSTNVQTNYESNDFGISFTHPTLWQVKQADAGKIRMVTKENGEFIMEIFKISPKNGETLSHWIGVNYKNSDILDTVFGGVEGKRVSTNVSDEEIILIGENGFFYSVHFNYVGRELDVKQVQRDFAELANSFVFFVPGSRKKDNTVMNSNVNTSQDIMGNTSTSTDKENVTEKTPISTNSNTNASRAVSNDNKNTSLPTTSTSAPKVIEKAETVETPEILSYMKSNGYLLPAGVAASTVSKVEVAQGKYVYVTFQDGGVTKKAVFSVVNTNGTFNASEQGLFQMDDATSKWTTLNGVNPAPNSTRDVYTISSGAVAKKTSAGEGKNVYSNATTGIEVQYPKNWYYEGATLGEKGGLQQVTFTSKPADQSGDTVTLKVYKADTFALKDESKTIVNGVAAYKIEKDGATEYAVKGKDGKLYVTSGSNATEMGNILKSVQ